MKEVNIIMDIDQTLANTFSIREDRMSAYTAWRDSGAVGEIYNEQMMLTLQKISSDPYVCPFKDMFELLSVEKKRGNEVIFVSSSPRAYCAMSDSTGWP